MLEEFEEKIKKEYNLTEHNLDLFKIILMIGLIITMIIMSIVIWKYGYYIKSNPCDLCDCSFKILKEGLK